MQVEGVHRPARAEISASAIAHNVRALKSVIGDRLFCAVVKANGYGHGAVLAATAALDAGADMLAVAIIDEGIELRESGITAPILLLAEVPPDTLAEALASTLTLTIGSLDGARAAVAIAETLGGRHRVHLKVDTGMHRMGTAPDDVDAVIDVLTASDAIDLEGVYTHFSVADGSSAEDRTFTRQQIDLFDEVVTRLTGRGVSPRIVHVRTAPARSAIPTPDSTWCASVWRSTGTCPRPGWRRHSKRRVNDSSRLWTLRAKVVAVRHVDVGERPSYRRRRAMDRAAQRS